MTRSQNQNSEKLRDAISFVAPARQDIADNYDKIYQGLIDNVNGDIVEEEKQLLLEKKGLLESLSGRLIDESEKNDIFVANLTIEELENELNKINDELLSSSPREEKEEDTFAEFEMEFTRLTDAFRKQYLNFESLQFDTGLPENFLEETNRLLDLYVEIYLRYNDFLLAYTANQSLTDEFQEYLKNFEMDFEEVGELKEKLKNTVVFAMLEKELQPYLEQNESRENLLGDLRLLKGKFMALGSLPLNIIPLYKKHVNFISWNIARLTTEKFQHDIENLSAENMERDLENLKKNADVISEDDLRVGVGTIVMQVLNMALDSPEELPKKKQFYLDVIGFIERLLKNGNDSQKAQGKAIIAQLYTLAAGSKDAGSERNHMLFEGAALNMIEARELALVGEIEYLTQNIEIKEDHIPDHSILRHYLNTGVISLRNGRLALSDIAKQSHLEELYPLIKKQFELERIILAQENLDQIPAKETIADKFFSARMLLVKADRYLLSDEYDQARDAFLNFLKEANQLSGTADPEIQVGIEHAVKVLNSFTLMSLARLKSVANDLFGKDEKYRNFFNNLNAVLDSKISKVQGSSEYEQIQPELIKRFHWSDTDKPMSFPDNLELRADNRSRSERKKAQRLAEENSRPIKESYPKRSVIEMWNEIVDLESKLVSGELYDQQSRQIAYENIADRLRGLPGAIYMDNDSVIDEDYERFSALSGLYYRQALGDEIADADFQVYEKKAALKAKLENEQYGHYRNQAKKMLTEYLDGGEIDQSVAAFLKSQGIDNSNPELIKRARALIDEGAIDVLAETLLNSYVDYRVEKIVFTELASKNLSTDSARIWNKLDDMEGIFGRFNLSDQGVDDLVKQLTLFTVITILSMGFASLVEAAASGATLLALQGTSIGLRAARMAKAGNIIWRGGKWTVRVGAFTVSENVLYQQLANENRWGNFASDFALNCLMFSSVEFGKFAWQRVLGRHLRGEISGLKPIFQTEPLGKLTPGNLYTNAGKWGKFGLATSDYIGSFATEATIFTTMGVGQKLALGGMHWDDIDMMSEVGHSIITIAALRTGNFIFSPVTVPLNRKIETSRNRVLENADHKIFLENTGLSNEFFTTAKPRKRSSSKSEAVRASRERTKFRQERRLIDQYRTFIDQHKLPYDFFRGQSTQEVNRVMKQVNEIFGVGVETLTRPPRADVLAKLAIDDPLVFEVIVQKISSLPFTLDQMKQIAEKNPQFLTRYADKLEMDPAKLVSKAQVEDYKESLAVDMKNAGMTSAQIADVLSHFSELMTGHPKLVSVIVFLQTTLNAKAAQANWVTEVLYGGAHFAFTGALETVGLWSVQAEILWYWMFMKLGVLAYQKGGNTFRVGLNWVIEKTTNRVDYLSEINENSDLSPTGIAARRLGFIRRRVETYRTRLADMNDRMSNYTNQEFNRTSTGEVLNFSMLIEELTGKRQISDTANLNFDNDLHHHRFTLRRDNGISAIGFSDLHNRLIPKSGRDPLRERTIDRAEREVGIDVAVWLNERNLLVDLELNRLTKKYDTNIETLKKNAANPSAEITAYNSRVIQASNELFASYERVRELLEPSKRDPNVPLNTTALEQAKNQLLDSASTFRNVIFDFQKPDSVADILKSEGLLHKFDLASFESRYNEGLEKLKKVTNEVVGGKNKVVKEMRRLELILAYQRNIISDFQALFTAYENFRANPTDENKANLVEQAKKANNSFDLPSDLIMGDKDRLATVEAYEKGEVLKVKIGAIALFFSPQILSLLGAFLPDSCDFDCENDSDEDNTGGLFDDLPQFESSEEKVAEPTPAPSPALPPADSAVNPSATPETNDLPKIDWRFN